MQPGIKSRNWRFFFLVQIVHSIGAYFVKCQLIAQTAKYNV